MTSDVSIAGRQDSPLPTMAPVLAPAKAAYGFTLAEMAVVLVIVALLIGGMLLPLSAQQDIRYVSETEATLKNIQEALLGFAAANGRLPCPASNASNGRQSYASGGNPSNGECSNHFDGFLPAADLGIRPTDDAGFAIDAWGRRIRYAVTDKTINSVTKAMTRTDGIRSATMASVAGTTMLVVCTSATGITVSDCGTAIQLTDKAPAVVFSLGKNGNGSGIDEQANSTNFDAVFVSHAPTPDGSANGEFDDLVDWLSINVLINRLIGAGRLP
jgi:prepilin-type N-terminal cleavage/methylation domain-containing protein